MNEFESSPMGEQMTLKEMKVLSPIIEKYFEGKVSEKHDWTAASEIAQVVGCTEVTAKWIADNFTRFSSLDAFLDQPELEDLTKKQMNLLKMQLQKGIGSSAKPSTIPSVEERISSELGLNINMCRDIVEKWKQLDTLEELFENEVCEDVSRKQQKAIAVILTEEKTQKHFEGKEDKELTEFLSFIQSADLEMSERDIVNILEEAKKDSISSVIGATKNTQLTNWDKLRVLVHLFPSLSSQVLEKEILMQSVEFVQLHSQLKEVTAANGFSEETNLWIEDNLCEMESVHVFDNCESLTFKQLKVLKKQMAEPLEVFIEIRENLRGLQRQGNSNQASSGDDFQDAVSDATEALACKSASTPSFMLTEKVSKREFAGEIFNKGHMEFMESRQRQSTGAAMDAKTVPLITCADQTQGDRVVEQFLVRAEHIKQLCNLKEGRENFYYDISSGLNINFTELSNYRLDLVGVLGRLDNAKILFKKILSKDSFDELNETMAKEGSGMYLVVPQSLYSSETSKGFIYFYSKNDQDYQEANQKSRAIHFIRYVTQLTKNVVLLLDEKDARLLALRPSNPGKKKARSQKYNVCELELQKEDVKLDHIGALKIPWTISDCQQTLHASNAGLYLIFSRFQSPKTQIVTTEKCVTVKDFKHYFNLKQIHKSAEVCEEFKQKFLEIHHKDVHKQIEKEAASTKAAFLDGAEDSDLFKFIDFAIIQKIYKRYSGTDYKLMAKFFEIGEKNERAQKWITALQFTFKVENAISYNREHALKEALEEYMRTEERIEKIILLQILQDSGVKFRETNKLEALYTLAWDNYSIGDRIHWYQRKPQWSDPSIQKSLVDNLEKSMADEARVSSLKACLHRMLEILEKLTEYEVTENRLLQNSIASFKRECLVKFFQPKIDEEKRRNIRLKFSEIQQLERMEEIEQSKKQRTEVIESIVLSTKINEMRFKVKFTKTEVEESKMILEMHKLTMKSSDRDNLQRQQDLPLEAKMLTFTNICRIELPQLETPKMFPINAGLALLTANCGKSSKVIVYGTSKGQQQLKLDFGKKILQSEFDTLNRILCLYSEYGEAKELNFYQFDPEYKNCNNYSRIDLSAKFNFQGLSSMKLQYGSKFVWVLESTRNRVLKLNIKNGIVSNSSKLNTLLSEVGNFSHLQMAPNGQSVFLSTDGHESRSVMSETFNVLDDPLPNFTDRNFFHLPETTISLVAHLEGSEVKFQKLTIQGAQQEMKLQESSACIRGENETKNSKQSKRDQKHWMYNLQWVFMKFPCEDIFQKEHKKLILTAISCDNSDTNILSRQLNEIQNEIKTSLRVTFKPTKLMNDKVGVMYLSKYVTSFQENSSEYIPKMDKFLQKLIGFTPMQIARCQANEFLVLKDGVALSTENARDVFEMKENIDLGLFEAIFNWWSGNVKVVSSMGKQTTGKSYMLNHVMGSSFNISGARCTDGCWMTLNVQEDCLYVILDFEGLGSFERTDQDDMLLSLFNSAISTMTLFKTEHRIDRDTDQLFSKFNLGSDQLKGTGGIFNGSFVIVIKDVAEADLQDIGKEFIEKINNILLKEKQNNFITKLYKGGFHINPFPPFQTESFFEEMETLREDIISTKPLFNGGPMFRDTMKLLLAKLAINDFTPLGKQQIEARIKFIRNHLETALTDGVLVISSDETNDNSNGLTLLDRQNELVSVNWTLSLPELGLENIELNDTKCHYTEDGFIGLANQFSQHVTQTSSNFTLWRVSLEKFVTLCLENRFNRVEAWINGNLEAWKNKDNQEFDDAICSLQDKFNLEKTLLVQKYQFCTSKCSKCYLQCTEILGHTSAHSCTTSHMCMENCFYCEEESSKPCKHPFGHENQHVCSEFSHICGQTCSFSSLNGCPNECVLISNHTEDHVCSLKKHLCKKNCSVEICLGECQIDCSIPHEAHKCAKEQCVYECCVENCRNKCSARNHFHGNESLTEIFKAEQLIEKEEAPFIIDGEERHIEDHFCGHEHLCGMECEEDGYCEVLVEKTVAKEEIFEGKRSTFAYKRQFVQIGKKLPCLRKILPFEKEHTPAEHYCTLTTKDHICTEICPTCENICDKLPGHCEVEGDEKHHTAHGNMTKCFFICDREDFDVGDHKYKVGEQSVAEFCHLFCSSLGRGHIHVIECPGNCKDEFSEEHDHRRHETCRYGPNEEVPKDEIQHGAYWELIGFEDPCTGENSETFGKCPFYCSAVSHEEEKTSDGDIKRYHCELDLWHKPVGKLSETTLTTGTVSKDGHVFPCHHEASSFHWVFALDRSGSMWGQPWAELQKSTMAFMSSRKTLAPEDKYSILLHDHEVHLIEEYKTVKDFDGREFAKWSASGGNDFALAISESDKVITRHLSKSMSPVFIFMSDGICYNGEKETEELARKYKTDYKLKIYTIGFGNINFDKLKELARVGGGQYIECATGIKLESSFLEIASSMPPTVSVTSSK